jgi:hypothetical protein
MTRATPARLPASALALFAAIACSHPIVEDEVHEIDAKMLTRIAVIPFLPATDFRAAATPVRRRAAKVRMPPRSRRALRATRSARRTSP